LISGGWTGQSEQAKRKERGGGQYIFHEIGKTTVTKRKSKKREDPVKEIS